MFGTHEAIIGGKPALMANVEETVCSMIYPKLNARPIPRYMPMPPFRFLEESEAPMMVRMNDANDEAIRL